MHPGDYRRIARWEHEQLLDQENGIASRTGAMCGRCYRLRRHMGEFQFNLPRPMLMGATFFENFRVLRMHDAAYFASGLFWDSFRASFPVPRDNCGLPIPTPRENWYQYVALYRGDDQRVRTVGFCNWIRYGDMYLEGGMCVARDFYRRLPRDEFSECRAAGGVAQLMMERAAGELSDASAWFGYCGDKKAMLVNLRAGYQPTKHQYLIVKWFRSLPLEIRDDLVATAAAIGPF